MKKRTVEVTLQVRYDPGIHDHPMFWDWALLAGEMPEDCKVVASDDEPEGSWESQP